MALNMKRHREFKDRGLHPKGTYQQADGSYVWPEEPTVDEGVPAPTDRKSAPITTNYTVQSFKVGKTPKK